jgi:hypothetical protein
MKYATSRPYADPEKAARRILEIANAVEPIQGRIHIEEINEPFLFRVPGSPGRAAGAEMFALMSAARRKPERPHHLALRLVPCAI